ncbi:MAG: NADH-quinone oxidoreductase subunit NuoF [Bryobacterales bacterium]|nr:NADH-quinone oxidoreductase subunit NuoF [Bryobacterales bacterium]
MRSDGVALDLKAYERAGGYEGLRKALGGMTPAAVIEEVKDSNLRGRGGAGFPTGLKWSFIPDKAPHPRYVVANGDEMEPGTFKDRILVELDPHQLVEGMILAGYATGADIGYAFLRGEYTVGAERVARAIAEAYEAGYLGKDILHSGYSFEIYLHLSAGRYMCGEETGLLNALEGKRANPRAKPPFPPASGLFGKPTTINNVETLCNVPHIIRNGAGWYRGLSRSKDGGTKIYGASGKVKRPGLWELPMGTTIREIIEEHAGGMRDGLQLRGLLPGGASTDFLTGEHLDAPMDFAGVQSVGSRLGTGTMIILDDKTCPVGMVSNLEHFFSQESCGWCTPCWSGLGWAERILRAMEEGRGKPGDLEKLAFQARFWAPGHTFCALAPGAAEPLQSALKHFRADFERHIDEKRCPWK